MDRRVLGVAGIVGGIAVLVLAVTLGGTGPSTVSGHLAVAGIDAPGLNYSVVDVAEREVAGIDRTDLRARQGDRLMRVTVLTPMDGATAAAYMDDRHRSILSRYTDGVAPYSGIPDREIDCPDRFVPDVVRGPAIAGNATHYELYADGDHGVGACSAATARYRADVLLRYCPDQGTLVVVERFVPVDGPEADASLRSIRCGRG